MSGKQETVSKNNLERFGPYSCIENVNQKMNFLRF